MQMKLGSGLVAALLCFLGALGCGAAPDVSQSADEEQSLQQAVTSNALTKDQAGTVLKLIDDICGDSWCEGDRNFHFDSLECSGPRGKAAGTCRLRFRLFPHDSDLKTGPSYARSCKTSGFSGFASLVNTAPSGYQSLNWDYYDALSTCINQVESRLPPL